MNETAAELMLDTLLDWGVDTIFGMPGESINGIMDALRKKRDFIQFVQVRHEESAAFMACAHAKYTGRLGVCLANAGAGGLHLLNGLYDAKGDRQPVLALTGMPDHGLIGTGGQQDIELDKVFEDVAIYNQRIMDPEQIESRVDQACRAAISRSGVAHLAFPADYQFQKIASRKSFQRKGLRSGPGPKVDWETSPDTLHLIRAAEVLNSGEKVVILVGRGAQDAIDEVIQVAEILNAPITKALLGKAAIPDDSTFCLGGLGFLGTRPAQNAIEESDTLFMIGTSFPYSNFLPSPEKVRAVQIDRDPVHIGLRFPVAVSLVGDSKKILEGLIPHLKQSTDRRFLEKTQNQMESWWQSMKEKATRRDRPMKPQVVAWELGKRLSEQAILSCDSGTVATWWARLIPAKRGQMHTTSGSLGTMACALPYAIAAQVAYPHRQSVALVGDGAFSMLMAEFSLCVKYKLPVKVVILKNNALAQTRWEQTALLGNPEFGVELEPIDFVRFAEACGGTGLRIDDPAECGALLDEALSFRGPVIVEAIVDPLEPLFAEKISGKR